MTDSNRLIVGIADIKTGVSPQVIYTSVGSCIAVCLYDEKRKAGGMLHLMLASSSKCHDVGKMKKAKYADTGITELVDQMKVKYGSLPGSLKAKVFGGAKSSNIITTDIGKENEVVVRQTLAAYRIPLAVVKTGGEKGYQISFNLENGKVQCQIVGCPVEEF